MTTIITEGIMTGLESLGDQPGNGSQAPLAAYLKSHAQKAFPGTRLANET